MGRRANSYLGEVIFDPSSTVVPANPEATLLELALEANVDIGHSCEGMGTCGTCHVFVEVGGKDLPPRNEVEAERANDLGFRSNERLACQIPGLPGLRVRVP